MATLSVAPCDLGAQYGDGCAVAVRQQRLALLMHAERCQYHMQHDAIIARVAVMSVGMPACGAQVQLHIAVDPAPIGACQHGVTEIRPCSAATSTLIHDAVGVAALG